MSKTWGMGILLSLLVCGSASQGVAAPEHPKSVRDVLRDGAPEGRGIENAFIWVGRLRHALHHVEVSKSAKNARLFMDEAIKDIDFDAVFETPIAYDLGPNTKLFSILGGQRESKYKIDYRKGPVSSKDLVGPLSFASGITFKELKDPVPDESRGIGIGARWYVNTAELSHRTVGRYLSGVLRLAHDHGASGRAGPPSQDRGQKIWEDLRKTFPRLMAFVETYVNTTPVVVSERKDGLTLSRAGVTFALKMAALKRDYPEFGGYLERMIEALELNAKIVYRLPTGEEYATIVINGPKGQLSLECLTDGGRLVPRKADGSPHLSGAFDPATVVHHQAKIVTNFSAQLLGLHVDGRGITLGVTFAGSDSEAKIVSKLQSAPTPKITGAFVGLLPAWAIDAFIPGTMEGYGKTFFTGLMKAKGSDGSFLTSHIKSQGGMFVSTNSFGTALVENSFLLIGLRMIQKHLWPDDRVMDDIGKIVTAGVDNLYTDVRALRTGTYSH